MLASHKSQSNDKRYTDKMPSFNATTTSSRRTRQSRRQRNRRTSETPIRGIFNILTDSKKEAAEYHAKVDRYFAIWRERTACQIIDEEELAEIRARVDSAEMYQRVCNNLFNLLSTCLENKDYAILAFDLMTQMLALRKFVRDNPVPDLEENEPTTTFSDEEEYFDRLKAMDEDVDDEVESMSSDSSNIDDDNRSYTSTERELLCNYYRYRPSCYDSDNSDMGTYSYSEQERRLVRRLARRDARRQRTMTLLNNMSNSDEMSAINEERADIARQRRQLLAERETLSREIEELRRQREEMELEEQLRSEEEEEEPRVTEEEPIRLTREVLEEHERMQQRRYNLRARNTDVRYSEYTINNAPDDQDTTIDYFDEVISVSDDEEMEETDELPQLEHSSKEYAPGKTLVTIKNMRLCNRMDVEKHVADNDVGGIQWPVGVLPGVDEEQEELDRRYFCEMTNNSKCDSQTLTNEELNDPLTLAAAMLRECPLCTKEKAGFNIVYTRTCQHHMCRKCLLKLAIVARREKRDITCPICRTQINEIFGFTRGQGKRGRMTFFSCVPTPCLFQSM